MKMFKLQIAVVFLGMLCASCASTNIENIGQAEQLKKYDDEESIWKEVEEAQEKIKYSGFIYEDPELTAYLNRVLGNLVGEEQRVGLKLKVIVLKDPMFNAFAYPNGAIYVHTAVLAELDNEAQLATILGHEATHFFHRHALREMRSVVNKSAFYNFFNIATAGAGGASMELANILIGKGIEATVYGYSRDLEREADEGGFQFLVKAGYDPTQSKAAFERLLEDVKEEKIKVPYFYHSHPRVQERVKNFDQMIADLKSKTGGELTGKTNAEEFRQATKKLLLQNAEMTLMRNRPDMAQKQIDRYLAVEPNDARAFCLSGETHLRLAEKLSADEKKMKEAKTKTEIEDARKQAVADFEKSIALNPEYPDAYRQLGLYYYKNKEKEKAKPYLSQYLKLDPNGDRADYIRGYLNES